MNKDKLIALCHRVAKSKGIEFNIVLTYYFLERIVSKIAASPYQSVFIFKGGFLLSNIIGIESRTTTDIDFVLNHYPLKEEKLTAIFKEILKDDLIQYELSKITPIKKGDPYGGYRMSILCRLDNIQQVVPLDIATGDPITPQSISYHYQSLFFSDRKYEIAAYNIESILAEKLETIYRRSFFNTRSKDFYDVYILYILHGKDIILDDLRLACQRTFSYRQTKYDINDFLDLLEELKKDDTLEKHWRNYQKQHPYVGNLSYSKILEDIQALVKTLLPEQRE